MRKPTHYQALTRFELERDKNNHAWYPGLPAAPGIAHSYRPWGLEAAPANEPLFLDSPHEYRRALCGKKVKVILGNGFRLDDPEACQSCVAMTHQEIETGAAAQGAPPMRPRTPFGK